MTRKLHRRSASRAYFRLDSKHGEFQYISKGNKGVVNELDDVRNKIGEGIYGNPDHVPYHRIEEVLRMVEAGFSDDDIAEFLLIQVEDVAVIIEEDRRRENLAREKLLEFVDRKL